MQQSGWRWPLGAALVLVLFFLTNSAGAQEALYARIIVDPKTTVYVEFKGEEMRMATSVAGIEKAKVVKASRRRRSAIILPEVEITASGARLPATWSSLKAKLTPIADNAAVGAKVSRIAADFTLSCKDKSGAQWIYVVEAPESARLGLTADKAPILFSLPELERASVKITTEIKDYQVGIAPSPMTGKSKINEIKRNGKQSQASLRITDSAGKIIANEKGDLDKFGFT